MTRRANSRREFLRQQPPPASTPQGPQPKLAGKSKRRASTPPRATRASKKGRGLGFTGAEVEYLLDLLEDHLPLTGDEWDGISMAFNEPFNGTAMRTTDSLRRTFSSLHRKRMPTGNPNMHPTGKRAKLIRHEIDTAYQHRKWR
ncbi:TPA: hypothetical protein N0F65_006112 [Lagenidium giganteum]|uniref:DUF6818 domain-containing protein n=1 Tax=Lagenidium giganteum TaxID=4803 RepID=A0AAV2Z641_9STRA|nr:TPA: hypothetical protein N0F65_006112 [Lagenidium giganteum]